MFYSSSDLEGSLVYGRWMKWEMLLFCNHSHWSCIPPQSVQWVHIDFFQTGNKTLKEKCSPMEDYNIERNVSPRLCLSGFLYLTSSLPVASYYITTTATRNFPDHIRAWWTCRKAYLCQQELHHLLLHFGLLRYNPLLLQVKSRCIFRETCTCKIHMPMSSHHNSCLNQGGK